VRQLVNIRSALAAVTVLAALALAACGGGSSSGGGEAVATTESGSADALLAAAATKATDAGSSKVDFTITTQIPGQEGPVNLTGNGEFDYANQQGKLTYDFSELFAAAGQPVGNEPVEVILDKNVVYMKFALLSKLIPGGKPWLKFDIQKIGEQQGLDLSQLQQLNQGDPSQILGYLRGSGSVEEVGKETIDGVETTHYTAVIDLDRVASQAPPALQDQVQTQIDKLKEQTGIGELPMEVWIDDDGLPRRVSYTFDASLTGGSEKTSTVLTMNFTDYGVDVAVEPPPADQVTDISELSGGSTG
jgi:hypothetical protein